MYSSRPIISLVTKVNAADAFLALHFFTPIYPRIISTATHSSLCSLSTGSPRLLPAPSPPPRFSTISPLVVLSTRSAVAKREAASSSSSSVKEQSVSTLDAIRKVVADEGLAGLYSGLSSSIVGIAATNTVFYLFCEWRMREREREGRGSSASCHDNSDGMSRADFLSLPSLRHTLHVHLVALGINPLPCDPIMLLLRHPQSRNRKPSCFAKRSRAPLLRALAPRSRSPRSSRS